MKKILTISLTFIALSCYSQNDSLYKIADWKGFSKAAVTYTFDDACANQYKIAIPMFNEFNYDATFYPVINWAPNWTSFQKAADEGHEIASHTVSHVNFGNVTDSATQIKELKEAKESIEKNISGQSCMTIAYPFCAPSKLDYTKKYYIAARHCQGNIESKTPKDFYNISSVIVGNQGSIKSSSDFNNKVEAAAKTNGWLVYLLHGIDNDGGYSPIPTPELRKGLDYLHAKRSDFWVSTFYNVVQYIRERDCATMVEIEVKNDTILAELNDTLDNSIYNYPLTIRRIFPENWTNVKVTQNGNQVITKYNETDGQKYVEFNVIPDSGIIILSNSLQTAELLEVIPTVEPYVDPSTSIDSRSKISLKISPNPFSDNIKIDLNNLFTYSIYSVDGRLMENGSGENTAYAGNMLDNCIYILKVKSETDILLTKIIKK